MRVLMINVVCGIRSTGRICTDLATALEAQGHEVKIAYGRENVPEKYSKFAVRIGNGFDNKMHGLESRLFDKAGFGSRYSTIKFINWVKEYDPDIIHLHNIHGYYINVEILFRYLKECGKRIIWTLHDCWSFTGHCVYFDYANCNKWKTGCCNCPQINEYPKSLFIDNSIVNYSNKIQLFKDVKNMVLVTPSIWLSKLVKESFMNSYPVYVINNGVDTNIFHRKDTDLKKQLGVENKKIILGVAAIWDRRKGFDSFLELSKRLSDEYIIILIGLTNKQISQLPNNVIGLQRTNSADELANYYSIADVYVNPTLEDNYPTTNIESIACGTPVITYNTGGSIESARIYGSVVEKKNIDELIKNIYENNFENKGICVDYHESIKKYLYLYKVN